MRLESPCSAVPEKHSPSAAASARGDMTRDSIYFGAVLLQRLAIDRGRRHVQRVVGEPADAKPASNANSGQKQPNWYELYF